MAGGFFYIADLLGVAVFAASGALEASRKRMDLVGFGLLATLTGIGGGTLRDIIMDRPVFWLGDSVYLPLCLTVALAIFIYAPTIERRQELLVWLDAAGLALFAVLGTAIADSAGLNGLTAIVMGIMTATFGGLLRDVVCNEQPLILSHEIYASAAALAGFIFILLDHVTSLTSLAICIGVCAGFALRAGGILRQWALPRYKPRQGNPRR